MHFTFWRSQPNPGGHPKKRNYKFSEQHDVLGVGGYSIVYRAQWNGEQSTKPFEMLPKHGQQTVALKIVPKNKIYNREAYHAILNAQGRMNHPNYLLLFDWFESSHKYYLAFQLAEGGDLFDRLVNKPYSEPQARRVLRQMLDVVEYSHSVGMIHRDIKPENWLFHTKDAEEGPLLADFGVGHVLSDPNEEEVLWEICGTPGYAAPEVFQRHGYNRKCDLFSCGVVGYALLTAWSPWSSESAADLIQESASNKVSFSGSNWKNISESAKDMIAWLLNPDPKKRPNATEALKHPWLQDGAGPTDPEIVRKAAAAKREVDRASPEEKVDTEGRKLLVRGTMTLSHQRPGDPLMRTLTKRGINGLKGEDGEVAEGAH